MKKVALILCLLAALLALTACTRTQTPSSDTTSAITDAKETSAESMDSASDPTETTSPATEAPAETTSPATDAPAETTSPATDAPTETTSPATEAPDETTSPATDAPDETEFQNILVIDNEYCKIEITGIDPDNFWGYTVKAHLENKSSDKLYMFSVDNAWINGVECDPLFATEVAAGKKANDSIYFSTSALEENGITDFTDIEIRFRVYDSDDWSADDVVCETVHIYPLGEENATTYVRGDIPSDYIAFDNEYATLIITGYEWDDIWGYVANIYLVNKTDLEVMVSVDEASVNGYMADPFFATTVDAHKSKFSSLSWNEDTLAENGITTVESIEFTVKIYDNNDWFADDLVNLTVTLNP